PQGGPLWRSHNADTARKSGNRLFTGWLEKSFGFEFCFELLEGNLQRTRAFGFQVLGRKLQFAAIFVNSNPPTQHDLHAVFRAKTQQACLRAEHDVADLRDTVLQREVNMYRIVRPKIRNFALHPNITVLAFEMGTGGRNQVPYRPDAAVGRLEGESKLVCESHCDEFTENLTCRGSYRFRGSEV